MTFTVTIAGNTETPLLDSFAITWDLNENQARASLSFLADSTFAIDHQDAVLIKEGATTRFTGRVRNFARRKTGHQPGEYRLDVDVVDHVSLMTDKVINKGYIDTDDQDIIIDIISEAGLSGSITANTTNVDTIKTALTMTFNGSVRDAIDQIAALSGGVWYLGADATLYYNTVGNSNAAAFHLTTLDVTNSLLRSEEIGGTSWTNTNCTQGASSTVPGGDITAYKITENSDTSQTHVTFQNLTLSANQNVLLSVYAKAAGRTKFWLELYDKAGTINNALIDLTAETATLGLGSGTPGALEDIGGGWYRASFWANAASGAETPTFDLVLGDASGNRTYNGDGTSGVEFGGAQLQLVASSSTPLGDYVYTTSAAEDGKGHHNLSVVSRFDQPCNTVNIIGGEGTFGEQIKVTRTDSQSVTDYGTIEKTISVPTLTTTSLANDWGDAFLSIHANPELTGRCTVTDDGVEVGQLVRVTSADYALVSKEFLVSRVVARQKTNSLTEWEIILGRNTLSAERLLRRFEVLGFGQPLPFMVRGMDLTGTNSYMIVDSSHASSDLYQDASGGLTISAWLATDGVSGGGGIVNATSTSEAASDGYYFYLDDVGGGNRKVIFNAGVSGTSPMVYKYSTNFPQDGLWHHVLVSWNGVAGSSGDCKIYTDGFENTTVGTLGSGNFVQNVNSDLSLGDFKDIRVTQVCVWNRQLKDGDIQRLAAKPDYRIPPSIFPDNRVVYWRMDDYADGATIATSKTVQDTWAAAFDATTNVTTSGDFGTGSDTQFIP